MATINNIILSDKMNYKKERIKYIDLLKFLAIFGIIAFHIFNIWPNAEILNFDIINFKEIVRYGVPIFLMVSGALLLNRNIELKEFMKKRLIRIALPLIFYLIIAYVLNIYKAPLGTYWYCWMVICVYLAIPIINIFIKNAKMKEIEYFLILFAIATLIYQIALYFNIKHCLDLNFFIGPVSFLILGYYLSKKEFNTTPNKMIIISLISFIIITILKMKVGDYFNFNTGNLVSYLNINFLQILQASTIFLMIRYLYEAKESIFSKVKNLLEVNIINKFILSISRASYGMYLFHMLIYRGFLEDYLGTLPLTGTQVCITILVTSIALFIVSWLGVLILGQIPYIKKLSGYY